MPEEEIENSLDIDDIEDDAEDEEEDEDEEDIGDIYSPKGTELGENVGSIIMDRVKVSKIENFYRGVNRILCGNAKLEVVDFIAQENVVGYCSARRAEIGLNLRFIAKVSKTVPDFIMGVKGINYHELGHYAFGVDCINEEAIAMNIKRELNILTDCRDESLFAITYPKAKDYFRYAMVKFLTNNPENFVLVYGRRLYASPKLLGLYEDAFKNIYGDVVCQKCKDIIDAFLRTNDIAEMHRLALELKNILPNLPHQNMHSISESGKHQLSKKTTPAKILMKLSEELKQKDEQDEQEQQEEKKKSEKKSEKEERNDEREQFEKLEKELDKILKDEEQSAQDGLYDEISSEIRQIGRSASPWAPPDIQSRTSTFTPSDEIKQISKRLEKVLKDVYDNLNARHERYLKKGRIDIKSVMKDQRKKYASARLFKQFKQNKQSSAKMGVVFCVDISGSMGSPTIDYVEGMSYDERFSNINQRLWKAKEACWSIATAMEKVGNKVAIVTFKHCGKTRIVKDFGKRGRWDYYASGGTDASEAYKWSDSMLKHLKDSENINNLLIITISDGDWARWTTTEELIEKINKDNIIETVELCVGDVPRFHCSNHQFVVKNYSELPIQLKKVMGGIQKRIVERIGE